MRYYILCTLVILLGACDSDDWTSIEFVTNPAAPGAGQASLVLDNHGAVLLSWVEQEDQLATLKFSRRLDGEWTAPRTIAEGDDWFVNWADFPSLAVAHDGRIVAHWLDKSAASTYAYDVVTRVSDDDGLSWTPPSSPHHDDTPTEHGFVSYFANPAGLGMAWLDGRNTGGGHDHHESAAGAMTLRSAILDQAGDWQPSIELDARVCDCCQTDAAMTAQGPVVVYRNRSDDEVRDIAIIRQSSGKANGAWSEPAIVHADNWKIEACPVNGPAVAAVDNQLAVAWFTMADDEPAVRVAVSDDAGASFAAPIRLDQDQPLGRVDVGMLGDGRAVASWLETDAFAETRVHLAVIESGQVTHRSELGDTVPARGSGFPRMVISDDKVFVVWREVDETDARLKTAIAKFPKGNL